MRYSLNAGIHQFVAVTERTTIPQSILSVLQLKEKPALKCSPIRVKASIFGEARKAAQEARPSDAIRILTQAGAEPASVQTMVETQSKPIANTTIGCLTNQNGKETSDGFTVIEGENGLRLVKNPEKKMIPDPELLTSPASMDSVIQGGQIFGKDIKQFQNKNRPLPGDLGPRGCGLFCIRHPTPASCNGRGASMVRTCQRSRTRHTRLSVNSIHSAGMRGRSSSRMDLFITRIESYPDR